VVEGLALCFEAVELADGASVAHLGPVEVYAVGHRACETFFLGSRVRL
jgi:hypothetical protein